MNMSGNKPALESALRQELFSAASRVQTVEEIVHPQAALLHFSMPYLKMELSQKRMFLRDKWKIRFLFDGSDPILSGVENYLRQQKKFDIEDARTVNYAVYSGTLPVTDHATTEHDSYDGFTHRYSYSYTDNVSTVKTALNAIFASSNIKDAIIAPTVVQAYKQNGGDVVTNIALQWSGPIERVLDVHNRVKSAMVIQDKSLEFSYHE